MCVGSIPIGGTSRSLRSLSEFGCAKPRGCWIILWAKRLASFALQNIGVAGQSFRRTPSGTLRIQASFALQNIGLKILYNERVMQILLLLIFVVASVFIISLIVFVDRINFPQKKFEAKSLPPGDEAPQDHMGAHMVDPEEDFAN